MKLLVSLPLVPLVLILVSLSPNTNAATPDHPVYDTDGRPVMPGKQYYLLPVMRDLGGGITTVQVQSQSPCLKYVAQDSREASRGLPLLFSPANPKDGDGVVRLSTDLDIAFDVLTICLQSTSWRLGNVEGKQYVITGGFVDNPGLEMVGDHRFRIGKWGKRDYKLVFCPRVCKTCKLVCVDVMVSNEGGKRLLGLTGAPFPIMFKRGDSG